MLIIIALMSITGTSHSTHSPMCYMHCFQRRWKDRMV